MAGAHTIYRKSKTANYVAVGSTLKLPSAYGYRNNSIVNGKYYNGAFPEFFHGFYKGSYGIDVGIMCDGEGFKLFFNAFGKTSSGQTWYSRPPMSSTYVGKGKTVVLKSYFVNGYIKTDCCKADGTIIDSLSVYLTTEAYASLSSGCEINREMCIAINSKAPNQTTTWIPAPAYFKDASWSAGTMTNSKYAYIAITNTSTSQGRAAGIFDSGTTPTNTYDAKATYGTQTNFATDIASATFDKTNFKI